MAADNLNHLEAYYAMSLEREDYRQAAWFAIRAMRRGGVMEPWKLRLRGCLARRHA